jgi:hypothetical protein
MRAIRVLAGLGLLASVVPTSAEMVNRLAENQVPVALVQIERGPVYTEVRLQTRAALAKVCWYADGPNSPYLLADAQRYRFQGGDDIATCPSTRNYALGEVMVLRFAPLPPGVHDVSLVEGQGGENQMVNPNSSHVRFWNFLHVALH